jgi:hypothetical protein
MPDAERFKDENSNDAVPVTVNDETASISKFPKLTLAEPGM